MIQKKRGAFVVFFCMSFFLNGTKKKHSGIDLILRDSGLSGERLDSAIRVMTWQNINANKLSWQIRCTQKSVSHRMTRSKKDPQKKKKEHVGPTVWTEDFSAIIAASAATKNGDNTIRRFVWEQLQAQWTHKTKRTEITQKIRGGPISFELTKDGCAPDYYDVWPTDFTVTTKIVRTPKGKAQKTIYAKSSLRINPALILPVEVLRRDFRLAALAKKSSFCYNEQYISSDH